MSTVFQPFILPSLQMVIQPFAEPVSLTEMKLHLKQDDITADDTLISGLIPVCRDVVETTTGRNASRNKVMMATTFDYSFDTFPAVDYIMLQRVPLISVVSITYVDNNGVTQTMSSALYNVNYAKGMISLAYQQVWPQTQFQRFAVTVRYIAGICDAFTAIASSTNTITCKGRTFTTGDRYRVCNSGGALPAGLAANTDYFVINPTNGNATCQLALTSGGSAVSLTDTGTGTNFIGSDITAFITLVQAMKLLCGHLNANREAVLTGLRAAAVVVPWSVEALCDSQHA